MDLQLTGKNLLKLDSNSSLLLGDGFKLPRLLVLPKEGTSETKISGILSRASEEKFSEEGATKNSTIKPFPEGETEKRPKIALLSLYLLYLYHV